MSNPKKNNKRLLPPVVISLVLIIIYLSWGEWIDKLGLENRETSLTIFNYLIGSLIWLTVALVVTRILDIFFWRLFIEKKLNKRTPKLIKQLINIIVFFIAILGIVGVIFEKSVTGLLTASGMIGLVVGFSIKNMISDVFSGIALNLDNTFRIGDYIYLHDLNINETAKVLEITWRTTRLKTLQKNIMVVANRKICTIPITNLSKNPNANDILSITIDPDIPSQRVINLMLAAAISTRGVKDEPPPVIRMGGISDLGIIYSIYYTRKNIQINPIQLKNDILMSIADHLQHSGFNSSLRKLIVKHQKLQINEQDAAVNSENVLKTVALFQALTDDEWHILLGGIRIKYVFPQDVVIHEGEDGDSMFVLAEGLLRVYLTGPQDKQLIPGDFIKTGQPFGEMSLLTGEKRSATVKAEVESLIININKEVMSTLFNQKPELIDAISLIIAQSQERNLLTKQKWDDLTVRPEETLTFSSLLANKIRSFFGMSKSAD